MSRTVRTSLIASALFCALFCALPAFAQLGVPGASGALLISAAPVHPAPNQSVRLTLSSPLYDLTRSTITWMVNGRTVLSGSGEDALTITAGGLGEETDVAVTTDGADGSASATISIIPTSIDLLLESDSYTPPFYRGRALASAGSHVTLVALPHFSAGSASADPTKLIYTWSVDGRVVASASGRGRASATFDAPTLYGSDSYTVDVRNADNSLSGEATVRLSDNTPHILLYEDTPLYGILFNQALGASPFVPDAEMTFFAAPLYAPARGAHDSSLVYDWTVNRTPVDASADNPNEITINAAKSSGVAAVTLSLAQSTNYFFAADGAWQITFTKQSGEGALTNDPFHTQ